MQSKKTQHDRGGNDSLTAAPWTDPCLFWRVRANLFLYREASKERDHLEQALLTHFLFLNLYGCEVEPWLIKNIVNQGTVKFMLLCIGSIMAAGKMQPLDGRKRKQSFKMTVIQCCVWSESSVWVKYLEELGQHNSSKNRNILVWSRKNS